MRSSEKVLLAFITLGILSFGTFLGWKFHQKSLTSTSASAAEKTDASPIQSNSYDDLSVRNSPYYNSMIKGRATNLNNNTAETENPNSSGWVKETVDYSNDNSDESAQSENYNTNVSETENFNLNTNLNNNSNKNDNLNQNSNTNSNSNNNTNNKNTNNNKNKNKNKNKNSNSSQQNPL